MVNDDYTQRELRLMGERDTALTRAERAEADLIALRLAARALVESIDDTIVGDLGPELAALRALVS